MPTPRTFCRATGPSLPLPLGTDGRFSLPADGWFQLTRPCQLLAPLEIPGADKCVNVVQVLDEIAARDVLAAFNRDKEQPNFPGILCDYEHKSETDDEDTIAAIWIDEMQVRNTAELWIKGRLTESGERDLKGGNYRLISPVLEYAPADYTEGQQVRPFRLRSAGLTNRPRIKGSLPLSNRSPGGDSANPNQNQPMNPDLLKELGLPPTATAEEALAAVRALKGKVTAADTSVAEIKNRADALAAENKQLLADAVEADLDKHSAVIANRDDVKAQLLANRKGTLAVLAALKPATPPTAPAAITNRDTAKTPAGTGSEEDQKAASALAAKIANRARSLRKTNPALSLADAYAQAADEIKAEPAK